MIHLNYKTFGKGPALVILHGLFGSLDNWISMARRLENDFTIYLIDQRNHGKSPHDDQWDYFVMAEDLASFLDQQGVPAANLLGHSMGGKTVMQFANDFPERIEKMIVADIAPVKYEPHHTKIIESLNQVDFSKLTSRQMVDDALKGGIPEESVRQFLMKGLARKEDKSFKWKFNLDIISEKYGNVLDAVSMDMPYDKETLFLFGERSNYVVDSYRPLIEDHFFQAKFQGIPEAGHWLHADAPEPFFRHVYSFLNGQSYDN